MPVLARAWQMLLKGHEEVRGSPRPLAAADMILVRLAYAADLPTPGDLARMGEGGAPRSGEPARKSPPGPSRKSARVEAQAAPAVSLETENPAPASAQDDITLRSFEDVIALADAKRDLKLKNALMEQVRLVRFKPGEIELNPLPYAAQDLTQERMKKLKAWTGRVWIVAVTDEEGAAPLGQQRREKEKREIEEIKQHPAVKEVLQHFPGARIAAVRPAARNEPAPLARDAPDEPEPYTEDGTNA
jgi:DNA polymerase-3 subunit gamma/tau